MRWIRASAAVALTVFGVARADTPPKPQAQTVAQGVWLIPGSFLPNRQPDGNTVIFAAPRGLIVMDTGRHVWQREAIEAFAVGQKKVIAAIVNSHWHLDHVSGNPDLKGAYPAAKVYASVAIKDALTGFLAKSAADAKLYLESGKLPPETAEDIRNDMVTVGNGKLLLPDVVIADSRTRRIAGKPLAVNLASNAATAGDVWVFDPVSGVAAVGDLVTLPAPFLDTACPAGWSGALAKISATPFRIVIPGHGAPMTRSGFATYRRAFDAFIDCASSARDKDACAAEWTANVATLLGTDEKAQKQGKRMAAYYVGDVLRKNGGKSADCKVG